MSQGLKWMLDVKIEILPNIGTSNFSIKLARKRGADIVGAVDARNALRRVNPSMVIKHALMDPQTFAHVEDLDAKYFNLIKNKLESHEQSALLDAGCG